MAERCGERILRAELWDVENEYAEQREVWERERSVGCALLCHPLVLSGRAAAGAHVRVPCVRTAEQLDEEEQGGGGRAERGCRGPIGNL